MYTPIFSEIIFYVIKCQNLKFLFGIVNNFSSEKKVILKCNTYSEKKCYLKGVSRGGKIL